MSRRTSSCAPHIGNLVKWLQLYLGSADWHPEMRLESLYHWVPTERTFYRNVEFTIEFEESRFIYMTFFDGLSEIANVDICSFKNQLTFIRIHK